MWVIILPKYSGTECTNVEGFPLTWWLRGSTILGLLNAPEHDASWHPPTIKKSQGYFIAGRCNTLPVANSSNILLDWKSQTSKSQAGWGFAALFLETSQRVDSISGPLLIIWNEEAPSHPLPNEEGWFPLLLLPPQIYHPASNSVAALKRKSLLLRKGSTSHTTYQTINTIHNRILRGPHL